MGRGEVAVAAIKGERKSTRGSHLMGERDPSRKELMI